MVVVENFVKNGKWLKRFKCYILNSYRKFTKQ